TEMAPEGDIHVIITDKPAIKLAALLPMAFGPKDLGFKEGALPVKETNLARPKSTLDELTLAAHDAARKSYAPYTKAPSGVAVLPSSGRIFKGAYIENVAFNPSLGPFQVALAALIVAGEATSSISRAALVEMERAMISQQSVAEPALKAIAPAAKFEVVTT